MKWPEVREQFPSRFVLVEALKAFSHNKQRIIEEMGVVGEYDNSTKAWNAYKKNHKENPDREFYIFHTDRESITIVEQYFTGVRGRV